LFVGGISGDRKSEGLESFSKGLRQGTENGKIWYEEFKEHMKSKVVIDSMLSLRLFLCQGGIEPSGFQSMGNTETEGRRVSAIDPGA